MRMFFSIALISMLSLTGCSTAGRIETQKDIAQACPNVKEYSTEKQCQARKEAKAIAAAGVSYPTLQEMLVDGKVMRDQSRNCRGMKIPTPKGKCK